MNKKLFISLPQEDRQQLIQACQQIAQQTQRQNLRLKTLVKLIITTHNFETKICFESNI